MMAVHGRKGLAACCESKADYLYSKPDFIAKVYLQEMFHIKRYM